MLKLQVDNKGIPLEMPFKISECKEKELNYSAIASQMGFLKGKILTIIDASVEDRQRNKALKDLIRNEFSIKLDWIYQLCGLPKNGLAEGVEEYGGNSSINQNISYK